MDYVVSFALCQDMMARDVQDEGKKTGLPWTLANSFTAKEKSPAFHNLKLWLNVNSEVRKVRHPL